MALKKTMPTDFGIEINYHKMTEVRLLECGQLRMRIDSYPTMQQRQEGKEALVKKEYVIEKADKIILGAFYSLLKASFPEFADSEDVLEDVWKLDTGEATVTDTLTEPVTETTEDTSGESENENA